MRCYSIISVQQTHRHPEIQHPHTHWDGWVCQSAEQTVAQSSAVHSLPQQRDSHSALQSVERISLHLHRKHCHRFHFSISLCTYIHLLINPACLNQPCKHASKVWKEHVDNKGKKMLLWWHWSKLTGRRDVLMILQQEERQDEEL